MKDEEEIYVTCICGALVNEANMAKHFEACIKESFFKHAVSLKINPSSSKYNCTDTKEREVCAICIRCGHPIVKGEGTLLTLYPSMENSSVTCCRYKGALQSDDNVTDFVCEMCKLPIDFHKSEDTGNENKVVNCIENMKNDANGSNDNKVSKNKSKWRKKYRMRRDLRSLDCISEQDDSDMNDIEHEHSEIFDELVTGPSCKQCHVALLPNYCKGKETAQCQQKYSLLVQILDGTSQLNSQSTQTDLPETRDMGIQVKISGVYPEEVEKLMGSEKGQYAVPEFDPALEAAFQSHLQSLIPCTHCDRTFSPDRILKHESCCIERPKSRQCVTPVGGEIPR